MKLKIALSTSLSYEDNWDPIVSLEITKILNIKYIQIYISETFFKKERLVFDIIDQYSNDLEFLIHSPADLNYKSLNPDLIKVIKSLSPDNSLVVYHHDYTYAVADTIQVIQQLNKCGITVLLENFYDSKTDKDILENLNHYKELLKVSKELGLSLFPLLDIPRLFIEEIASMINPLEVTLNLIRHIKILSMPLYLHLIDATDSTQNRDSWCPLGQGYIPYSDIFKEITSLNLEVPLAVLEYEQKIHIPKSLKYLKLL